MGGAAGPLDPASTGGVRTDAPRPPDHYEQAVAAGVERIAAGELEKLVLAREVTVTSPAAHDAGPILGALRGALSSCFCFCVGTPEAVFIGASPELLIRRRGAVAATVALAGSTSAAPTRRGRSPRRADAAQRQDPEEHRSSRAGSPSRCDRTVWVEAEEDFRGRPRVANIQHLATPIQAQLADSRSAIELAGLLHLTPAVGGEFREAAVALVEKLEDLDRGWYAGPVGWMDAAEDGEFCVALRSGPLRDRTAHLYAGCGIVAGSDPADELAEAEIKLEALLPLVSG